MWHFVGHDSYFFGKKMWHCGKWSMLYMFESMWCTCKSDHQMRGVYVHIGGHKHFPCRHHCDRYLIQIWKSIKWNRIHMCKQHESIAKMHVSAMQSSMNQWVIMPYHTECWRWVQTYRRWRVSTADIHGSKLSMSTHTDMSVAITEQCMDDERHCEWINQAYTGFQDYRSPKSMIRRRFLWSGCDTSWIKCKSGWTVRHVITIWNKIVMKWTAC